MRRKETSHRLEKDKITKKKRNSQLLFTFPDSAMELSRNEIKTKVERGEVGSLFQFSYTSYATYTRHAKLTRQQR